MKKMLGVLLAGALLVQAAPAYAADNQDNLLKIISFDTVRQEILVRNPTIISGLYNYSDGMQSAGDMLSLLKQQEGLIDGNIFSLVHTNFKTEIISKMDFTQRLGTQVNALPDDIKDKFSNLLNSPVIAGIPDPVTVLLNQDESIIYGVATGKDSSDGDLWLVLFPAQTNLTLNVTDTSTVNIAPALEGVNLNLLTLYEAQISSLESQLKTVSAKKEDSWKSLLQIQQGQDQIIWGAQQLVLGYNDLDQQVQTLKTQRDVLQKQLEVGKLQIQLGLITALDQSSTESKIRDLDFALKSLADNEDGLRENLNVLLGQDIKTLLTIQPNSAPEMGIIQNLDYNNDLKKVLNQNFNIRLAGDTTSVRDYDNQQRKTELDFDKAFKNVSSNKEALEIEQGKLNDEKNKLAQAQLSYNLGVISDVALQAAKLPYQSELAKVKQSESNLLKAYTEYQWMVEGMDLSDVTSIQS